MRTVQQSAQPRKARGRGKPFQKGADSRRHQLTHDERVRGGQEAFRRVVFEILPSRYNDGRAVNFMRWVKGGAR